MSIFLVHPKLSVYVCLTHPKDHNLHSLQNMDFEILQILNSETKVSGKKEKGKAAPSSENIELGYFASIGLKNWSWKAPSPPLPK